MRAHLDTRIFSSTVLTDLQLAESADAELRVCRADARLYMDFALRRVGTPMPAFTVQGSAVYAEKAWMWLGLFGGEAVKEGL